MFRLGFKTSGDGQDVIGMVLAVGIRSHQALEVGEFAQQIVDAGFQGCPLTQVHRVAKYAHVRDGGDGIKSGPKVGTAAVVNNNDLRKAPVVQIPHQLNQVRLGAIGGDKDG